LTALMRLTTVLRMAMAKERNASCEFASLRCL
jgi:hypothetical protein